MPDATQILTGRHILIVEDEYFVAMDLATSLGDMGADVIGPACSVAEALALIRRASDELDGAVLDVNLRDERVYPVADALLARGVRFIFASGYDASLLPSGYAHLPRCAKPVDAATIARFLAA